MSDIERARAATLESATKGPFALSLFSDPEKRKSQIKAELSSRIGQEIFVFDSAHNQRFGGKVHYNSDNPEEMYTLELAPHTLFHLSYANVASLFYFEKREFRDVREKMKGPPISLESTEDPAVIRSKVEAGNL
ncbi:hypothetical protein HY212_04655 [Candidatus Pacearchaeota archaeon]|nr:hypothetical protein [Candidatus Pacearchaeota archaeon]